MFYIKLFVCLIALSSNITCFSETSLDEKNKGDKFNYGEIIVTHIPDSMKTIKIVPSKSRPCNYRVTYFIIRPERRKWKNLGLLGFSSFSKSIFMST